MARNSHNGYHGKFGVSFGKIEGAYELCPRCFQIFHENLACCSEASQDVSLRLFHFETTKQNELMGAVTMMNVISSDSLSLIKCVNSSVPSHPQEYQSVQNLHPLIISD